MIRLAHLLALLLLAIALSTAPVGAHEKKKHRQPPPAITQPAAGGNAAAPTATSPPSGDQMAETVDEQKAKDRSSLSTTDRLRITGPYKGKAIDRVTAEAMVLRRIGRAWKIVHVHWSSAAK